MISSFSVLLPFSQCRESRKTYSGSLHGVLHFETCQGRREDVKIDFGQVPVMVKSVKCHLVDMVSDKLVQAREDPFELGGYFVANGNERVIRMLIAERRNRVSISFLRSFSRFVSSRDVMKWRFISHYFEFLSLFDDALSFYIF